MESDAWWSPMILFGSIAFQVMVMVGGLSASVVSLITRRTMTSAAVVTFNAFSLAPVVLIGLILLIAGGAGGIAVFAELPPDVSNAILAIVGGAAIAAIFIGGWMTGVAITRLFRAFSQTRRAGG